MTLNKSKANPTYTSLSQSLNLEDGEFEERDAATTPDVSPFVCTKVLEGYLGGQSTDFKYSPGQNPAEVRLLPDAKNLVNRKSNSMVIPVIQIDP